jgi:hypothetical protein
MQFESTLQISKDGEVNEQTIEKLMSNYVNATSYNTIRTHLSVLIVEAMNLGLKHNPMQHIKRKRQEEREAALKGDNVGQRGLKTMLGGTELNLKKDKGGEAQELVREDWMNKPFDDMSDDEKAKFKEFEQKEKEFKEKQRKAWEQDLKKIKGEIIEI